MKDIAERLSALCNLTDFTVRGICEHMKNDDIDANAIQSALLLLCEQMQALAKDAEAAADNF